MRRNMPLPNSRLARQNELRFEAARRAITQSERAAVGRGDALRDSQAEARAAPRRTAAKVR